MDTTTKTAVSTRVKVIVGMAAAAGVIAAAGWALTQGPLRNLRLPSPRDNQGIIGPIDSHRDNTGLDGPDWNQGGIVGPDWNSGGLIGPPDSQSGLDGPDWQGTGSRDTR